MSGVTMIFDPLVFGDINRTIPEVLPNDPFQLCGWSFRENFPPEDPFAQNILQWNTFFTRNFQITNGPALPPGNKLVVQIFHDPVNDGGLFPFFGRGSSLAWFYEVLPDDVDGFSDCSLDFTNLIFLDQDDADFRGDPVDDPETFDASVGTVTYAQP